MSDRISTQELSSIWHKSPKAVARWIDRHKEIRREIVSTSSGIMRHIFVEDLLIAGYVTEEQLSHLTAPKTFTPKAPGTQLMARVIVQKKFDGLSEEEQRLLMEVFGKGWVTIPVQDRIKRLARYVGKSRAWLYRGPQQPKKRDTLFTLLTPEQFVRVKQLILTKRKFSQFFRAIAAEEMPSASKTSWRRLWNQQCCELRGERILVQKGETAHNQSKPFGGQSFDHLRPMEVCSTDYWRVDIVTQWIGGNTFIAPYLCVVRDERTTKIVGMSLTMQPCALGVKSALFQAMAHYGPIGTLNMDNGLEFNARSIVGGKIIEEHSSTRVYLREVADVIREHYLMGMLPAMNVKISNSIVRMPRGKGIERPFGVGGFSDWAEEMSGYIGRDYWNKPESTEKFLREARKTGQREFVDKTTGEIVRFMDYHELCYAIAMFAEQLNNRPAEKRTKHLRKGQSPNQLWDELTIKNPLKRIEPARLAFAFSDRRKLKVLRGSLLRYAHNVYFQNAKGLRPWEGKYVLVVWNPLDGVWLEGGGDYHQRWAPRELLVYTDRGEYICAATPQPVLKAGTEDKDMLKHAHAAYNAVIREERRNAKDIMAGNTPAPIVADVKTVPMEALKELGQAKRLRERQQKLEFRLKCREFGIAPWSGFTQQDIEHMTQEDEE